MAKCKAPKAKFALLVRWTETRFRPAFAELIEGHGRPFTMAEAEQIAREARRLGGSASVHAVGAARRLYEPLRPKEDDPC